MTTPSHDRNAQNATHPVAALGDMWGCPACDALNSTARTDCESCGQRVDFIEQAEAVDESPPDELTVDQWLDKNESAGAAEEEDANSETAEIARLGKSLLEWTCPNCGSTTQLSQRPELKLTPSSKILLSSAVLAGLVFVMLLLSVSLDGRGINYPLIQLGRGVLVMLVGALTAFALMRPRVVTIACRKCGRVSKEYKRSPISF